MTQTKKTEANEGLAADAASEIISDEQIKKVHGFANFGSMSPRAVVNEGVLKYAMGYSSGQTQMTILIEHGLIKRPRPAKYSSKLTVKGWKYMRAVYKYVDLLSAPDLAAEVLRLTALVAELTAANTRLVARDADARGVVDGLLQSICGPTGFAAAVRHNTGKPFPWPSLDRVETDARAWLAGGAE